MKALAAIIISLGLAGTAAADPVQFRNEARNISFAYNDNVWQPVPPPHSSIVAQIQWLLLGGEFIAMCRLQAERSDFADAIEGQVSEKVDLIIERSMTSAREYASDSQLLSSEARLMGVQEVAHLRLRLIYSSDDHPLGVTADMLYTARQGEVLVFQCVHPDRPYEGPALRTHVEDQIRAVIDSLSFGN